MRSAYVSFSIVILMLSLSTGCGSGYTFAPVSGKVTIDGQPGANCHVEFEPIGSADKPYSGPGSIGITDAQGVFTLKSVPDERDGAIVGKHRVRILVREGEPGGGTQEENPDQMLKDALARAKGRGKAAFKPLPAKHNIQTELTFDVPKEGTDKANLNCSRNSRCFRTPRDKP